MRGQTQSLDVHMNRRSFLQSGAPTVSLALATPLFGKATAGAGLTHKESSLNHIQHTKGTGASGALVSIFNAESKSGTVADYETYSRSYDKRVFDALADTKLTVLQPHYVERPYLNLFKELNAPVVQYSVKTSGIRIADVRAEYPQAIAG